jgi:predicted SprT family Zn-dependent metalloprotease
MAPEMPKKPMTGDQICAAVRQLATVFGMPLPTVEIVTRRRTSRAYLKQWKIRVSLDDWHGAEVAMVHEVAHLVATHRGHARQGPHDGAFFEALRDVATVWLGHALKYPWHQDYRQVWRRAVDQGLTDRRWHREERRLQAAASAPPVRAGDVVEWESRAYGRPMTGRVVTAFYGCRLRIASDDGRQWYVPRQNVRKPDGDADSR